MDLIFENPDSTRKGQLPPPFSVRGIHEENEAFVSGVWVSQTQVVSWICFYKLTPPDPVLPRMTLSSVRSTRPGESLPAQDRDKLSLLPFSLLTLLPLQICSLIPYFPLHRLHVPLPPIRTPSLSSLGAISLYRGRIKGRLLCLECLFVHSLVQGLANDPFLYSPKNFFYKRIFTINLMISTPNFEPILSEMLSPFPIKREFDSSH